MIYFGRQSLFIQNIILKNTIFIYYITINRQSQLKVQLLKVYFNMINMLSQRDLQIKGYTKH
jgi:uncharacterized protein affecting Mg2+/Co2+ transport